MASRRLMATLVALAIATISYGIETGRDNSPTVRIADTSGQERTTDRANKREMDAATEADVARLVETHLPELQPLLDRLRRDEPRQYSLAIRDLDRSSRRLKNAEKRDPKYFEREVELLKAQSQVRLLTARLKVRDSEPDRKELRVAVARLQQAEIERLNYDVQSLQQRIERAQKQLATAKRRLDIIQTDRDVQIEKNYLGFLRKAGRQPSASARKTD